MTPTQLRRLHEEWLNGRPKSHIEREEFGDYRSNGKLISRLWRRLGLETERTHPLVLENQRLRDLLQEYGIDPD